MGHVMMGETSETAIAREIHEELGIKIDNITFIKKILWEKYQHFIDIYVVNKDIYINDLTIQKSEVDEVKYISKNEMIKVIRSKDYRPDKYRKTIEEYVKAL